MPRLAASGNKYLALAVSGYRWLPNVTIKITGEEVVFEIWDDEAMLGPTRLEEVSVPFPKQPGLHYIG